MAELHLPTTLLPLFPGLERCVDVRATTVDEALEELNRRFPGLRDRLCEPGPVLRRHINVYVERERGDLGSPLAEGSRVDVVAAITGG
jgi:molybdopterin synthase sulfur carrier subunit